MTVTYNFACQVFWRKTIHRPYGRLRSKFKHGVIGVTAANWKTCLLKCQIHKPGLAPPSKKKALKTLSLLLTAMSKYTTCPTFIMWLLFSEPYAWGYLKLKYSSEEQKILSSWAHLPPPPAVVPTLTVWFQSGTFICSSCAITRHDLACLHFHFLSSYSILTWKNTCFFPF